MSADDWSPHAAVPGQAELFDADPEIDENDVTRTQLVAAIRAGTVLRITTQGVAEDVKIAHVKNADPWPGRLVLLDTQGRHWKFRGNDHVQVVTYP